MVFHSVKGSVRWYNSIKSSVAASSAILGRSGGARKEEMAKIFIAHSGQDKDLVDFFLRCFYSTKVDLVFEEIERILKGEVTTAQVRADINGSNAVFVILTENVERIPHTRDWVVSEAGVGSTKDIWVFEPYSQRGRVSVIIPFVRHYVMFGTNEDWMKYVNRIIKSYDDSHVLPTVAAGGGIGALLAGPPGAIIGAGVAAALSSSAYPKRPEGIVVRCPECFSVYNIHIPNGVSTFRCPVCNVSLQI